MICADLDSILYIVTAVLACLYFLRLYLEEWKVNDLDDKPVFITGCDTGFGYKAALRLAELGIPVYAGCLTDEGVEKINAKATGSRSLLKGILVDVTSDESVEKAGKILEEEVAKYGGLWAVINNAGTATKLFYDDFLTPNDYRLNLEVNLFGTIRISQRMKRMIKQKKGRIITTSSIAGRCPFGGIATYTVSKHAQSAYVEVLRKEMAIFGVDVVNIEPGFFKTPITSKKRIVDDCEAIWNRASADKKAEYGEDFGPKAIKHLSEFIDSCGSLNITPVIDTYVKAVTSVYPRCRYKIGWDCILLWNTIALAPTCMQEAIFRFLNWASGAPLPACIHKTD